jgi:hypothetical protein
MKTGRSLTDLAREIERQKESKLDLVASTDVMAMHTTAAAVSNEDKEPYLTVGRGNTERSFGINSVGHQQIATHTGIPAAYYKKMVEEAPDLLATNVNRWFAKYPANRMVRTLDNHVRAFLSDSYRPLENADLAEAVLPVLFDLKLEVMSCEVTETRLYLKCVDERIKQDVPSGRKMGDGSHCFFDTVSPAIIISNSEVGLGSLSVESGVFTKVCTNLMAISGAGMKKRHLGARTSLGDGEAIRHLLTDFCRPSHARLPISNHTIEQATLNVWAVLLSISPRTIGRRWQGRRNTQEQRQPAGRITPPAHEAPEGERSWGK